MVDDGLVACFYTDFEVAEVLFFDSVETVAEEGEHLVAQVCLSNDACEFFVDEDGEASDSFREHDLVGFEDVEVGSDALDGVCHDVVDFEFGEFFVEAGELLDDIVFGDDAEDFVAVRNEDAANVVFCHFFSDVFERFVFGYADDFVHDVFAKDAAVKVDFLGELFFDGFDEVRLAEDALDLVVLGHDELPYLVLLHEKLCAVDGVVGVDGDDVGAHQVGDFLFFENFRVERRFEEEVSFRDDADGAFFFFNDEARNLFSNHDVDAIKEGVVAAYRVDKGGHDASCWLVEEFVDGAAPLSALACLPDFFEKAHGGVTSSSVTVFTLRPWKM